MKSAEIGQLALALSKVQSQIKGAVKDSINPFFKSTYADLESSWDACREALAVNEFAICQRVGTAEGSGATVLITTLLHSSGQWIEGSYPIKPTKDDPQSFGSAVTYARRYSLQAMVGICAVEDDDAENSMGRKVSPVSTASKASPSKSLTHISKITDAKSILSRKMTLSEAENYVVTFGESKGFQIKDIPDIIIERYCKTIRDKSAAKHVPVTGEAAQFLEAAEIFMARNKK
jgi:hypothetical protein